MSDDRIEVAPEDRDRFHAWNWAYNLVNAALMGLSDMERHEAAMAAANKLYGELK
jgi:hypothetical protein